jgi:hypothetical protein
MGLDKRVVLFIGARIFMAIIHHRQLLLSHGAAENG